MSISMHLIAFGGVQDPPLFRAAIMESGNPTVQMTYTPDLYQPFFDNLTAAVNCSEAQDILACLRAVPYDDFFAAGGNVSTAVSTWQPVIDSVFVPGFPSQQLKEGKYFNVPILNGANTDEGYSFGPGGINTEDDLIDALYGTFVPLSLYILPSTRIVADYVGPGQLRPLGSLATRPSEPCRVCTPPTRPMACPTVRAIFRR